VARAAGQGKMPAAVLTAIVAAARVAVEAQRAEAEVALEELIERVQEAQQARDAAFRRG
jgi:hypothetical protein